ncbi:MAG: hypothetical protein U5J63_17310 [Fodinibius sp.]|nr:hypothetical protein [Fodinibius sp.]
MSAFEDHSGKIGSKLFHEILQPQSGRQRDEVVKGPRFGVDTAVIDLGDGKGLATSSDPLSLIPSLGLKESAWLSVHLLANDMATTGLLRRNMPNLPSIFRLISSWISSNVTGDISTVFVMRLALRLPADIRDKFPDKSLPLREEAPCFYRLHWMILSPVTAESRATRLWLPKKVR